MALLNLNAGGCLRQFGNGLILKEQGRSDVDPGFDRPGDDLDIENGIPAQVEKSCRKCQSVRLPGLAPISP